MVPRGRRSTRGSMSTRIGRRTGTRSDRGREMTAVAGRGCRRKTGRRRAGSPSYAGHSDRVVAEVAPGQERDVVYDTPIHQSVRTRRRRRDAALPKRSHCAVIVAEHGRPVGVARTGTAPRSTVSRRYGRSCRTNLLTRGRDGDGGRVPRSSRTTGVSLRRRQGRPARLPLTERCRGHQLYRRRRRERKVASRPRSASQEDVAGGRQNARPAGVE